MTQSYMSNQIEGDMYDKTQKSIILIFSKYIKNSLQTIQTAI